MDVRAYFKNLCRIESFLPSVTLFLLFLLRVAEIAEIAVSMMMANCDVSSIFVVRFLRKNLNWLLAEFVLSRSDYKGKIEIELSNCSQGLFARRMCQ